MVLYASLSWTFMVILTHYRIALCIDGPKRFTVNKRQLLGKEAIKQRHLRLLGYEVVQVRASTSLFLNMYPFVFTLFSILACPVIERMHSCFLFYLFRFLFMNLKSCRTRPALWNIYTRKSSPTVTG